MRTNKFLILILIFILSTSVNCQNKDGGMWIPSLIKSLNIADMQTSGLKLSADDVYSINKSSIKDAIVHFGGGCTAEIISKDGLLLTNHHCGYSKIQEHSTIEHNYLKDGFWAKSRNEELKNPGLTATIVVEIFNVTNLLSQSITSEMTETEREIELSKNIELIKRSISKKDYQNVIIKPFFYGNQYFAFVTETFKDVRLVGAPPSSIGKFGSDTDNWIWPRHTGDFSMFRIYASRKNEPAEISNSNVPYKPRHFLPISIDGVAEGDFTMVYGFPGRTQEYLPSVAIKQILEVVNPAKISIRDKALKIMDAKMRVDTETNIKYASKYARIANYWKKWIGENQGLIKSNAVEKRKLYEVKFQDNVNAKDKTKNLYGDLLAQFQKNYSEIEKYAHAKAYYDETVLRNIEILRFSYKLDEIIKNNENIKRNKTIYLPEIITYSEILASKFYKNYDASIDENIMKALLKNYVSEVEYEFMPNYFIENIKKGKEDSFITSDITSAFKKSNITSQKEFNKLLEKSPENFVEAIKEDPIYIIAKSMIDTYAEKVQPTYITINKKISVLQRQYMKAQMEVMKDRKFYPDANSTLRVTWGNVTGYAPKDGIYYTPVSHLKGVMEKYIPKDYEFDIPQKLISLFNKKEYGIFEENGKMPVNFIATNHTTGGNSGSPAIDAHGNLIGLNFDRVWEGTMSDINYDMDICRNIMVDIRYVLFIIDKYADSRYLLDEMKLVKPKSKK